VAGAAGVALGANLFALAALTAAALAAALALGVLGAGVAAWAKRNCSDSFATTVALKTGTFEVTIRARMANRKTVVFKRFVFILLLRLALKAVYVSTLFQLPAPNVTTGRLEDHECFTVF
jgi:hypothetical protein